MIKPTNKVKTAIKKYRSQHRQKEKVKAIHILINLKSKSCTHPMVDFYKDVRNSGFIHKLVNKSILLEYTFKSFLIRRYGEECFSPSFDNGNKFGRWVKLLYKVYPHEMPKALAEIEDLPF